MDLDNSTRLYQGVQVSDLLFRVLFQFYFNWFNFWTNLEKTKLCHMETKFEIIK